MFQKGLPLYKFIIILILLLLVVSLLVASTIWNLWRQHKYDPFTEGMKYATSANGIVPRYSLDQNGDIYYVKYPEYLSTTGNLAVIPVDNSVLQTLLIWPKAGGKYKYGVILIDGGTAYQVYIDPNGETALYEDYQWLVDAHREIIQQYLTKAKSMWDL